MEVSEDNRHRSLKETTLWENRKAILISCLIMSTAFQFGLDYGLIGGFQAMPGFLEVFGYKDPTASIGWSINPTVQQLIASLMTLGGFLGNILVGPLSSVLGRRHCLIIACSGCILALGLQFTTSIGAVYFARLIIGISIAFMGTFSQIYVVEALPPQFRGSLISMYSVWIAIGSIVASVIDNFTAFIPGRRSYEIPLSIGFIVPVICWVCLWFIPESPRWLVNRGKFDEAERALRRLRSKDLPEQIIATEIQDMKEAHLVEQELKKSAAILDVFRPVNLRRTMISVLVQVTQPATGVSFMLAYGVYFFEVAGSNQPFQDGIIVNCCGLIGVLISIVLMKKCRRRPILIFGSFGLAFSIFMVALSYTISPTAEWSKKCVVSFIVIYVFFYYLVYSPYPFLISGEVPNQRLRTYTFGVAGACSYFGSWLVGFTSPYFLNPAKLNWGPKYGWIWVASNLLVAVWVYFCVPETFMRTLEEIEEMFDKKVPTRQWRKYVCQGVVTAVYGGDKKDEVAVVQAEEVEGSAV